MAFFFLPLFTHSGRVGKGGKHSLPSFYFVGGEAARVVVGGARLAANFAAKRCVVVGEMGSALPLCPLVCWATGNNTFAQAY